MKMKIKLMLLILFATLVSCATGKFRLEPKNNNDTMFIGGITVIIMGEVFFSGMQMDGTYTGGIDIYIQDIKTGNVKIFQTEHNGLFANAHYPEGTYKINKFVVHYESPKGGGLTLDLKPPRDAFFTLTKGQVINIGRIDYSINYKTHKSNVSYSSDFITIEMKFKEKYPKSDWINYEWVNQKVTS
jgi:hypothetical protein